MNEWTMKISHTQWSIVLFSHKEEIMSLAGKWMELEIVMLSEIS
jgi:hypothetical protein